ncbi:hypothetical protein SUGI_1112910 [Cryptomeria japonica]|nr:hypothetical protein SUGI_1112910 [Cryptomeria japonica]
MVGVGGKRVFLLILTIILVLSQSSVADKGFSEVSNVPRAGSENASISKVEEDGTTISNRKLSPKIKQCLCWLLVFKHWKGTIPSPQGVLNRCCKNENACIKKNHHSM